jgi:hypothetical protein
MSASFWLQKLEQGKHLKYLGFIYFCERTRSRCYGRTAALGLIVQPCDKDEEKDD